MNTHAQPAALDVVSRPHDPKIGVEHRKAVAGALADCLADTYLLTIKTHGVHWNVMGPLFHAIHEMTEEHYGDMFEAADVMAERIRALGALAPSNVRAMLDRTEIRENGEASSAGAMIEELAQDHETVARRMHRLAEAAGEAGDIVSEDLAVERSAFHEKSAWMLRSLAAS